MREPETGSARLLEVIGLFLKLGATAFGGPAAHIALMRDEVADLRLIDAHGACFYASRAGETKP